MALLAVAACSQGAVPPGSVPAPVPSATVYVGGLAGDVVQRSAPVRVGHLEVRALLARCGIGVLRGTHAEFVPRNALCRVRLRVESRDVGLHTFEPGAQRLVLDDGSEIEPSLDAMRIKRQPDRVALGAAAAAEVELWWSLPDGRSVRAVRVAGDTDGYDIGSSREPPAPRTAVIPLALTP